MEKNSNVIIRINSDLKNNIVRLCKENNTSLSSLINAYLEDTVKRNKIPSNILARINYHKVFEKNILEISFIKKCLDKVILKEGKGDIKRAYLFGSYSRGDARNDSDVDIRIEVGDKLSLIDLSNIRLSLKRQLGKEVDLLSQDGEKIDKIFYKKIRSEEICLYEKR